MGNGVSREVPRPKTKGLQVLATPRLFHRLSQGPGYECRAGHPSAVGRALGQSFKIIVVDSQDLGAT